MTVLLNHSGAGRGTATPGPWEFEARDLLAKDDLQRLWIGRLAEGQFSALACGSDIDEAFANARLIAAAPELLQALGIARAQITLLRPADADNRVTDDVLAIADAAIAKAFGLSL